MYRAVSPKPHDIAACDRRSAFASIPLTFESFLGGGEGGRGPQIYNRPVRSGYHLFGRNDGC